MREDPLIIGGLGGSGTRVVARLAAGGVFMGRAVNETGDSQPVQTLYNKWLRLFISRDAQLDEDEWSGLNTHCRHLLAAHLDGLNDKDAPWGVKVPRNIFMLSFWQQRIPRFRFIHVLRHGLDMVYSKDRRQLNTVGDLILSQKERGSDELSQAMIYWCCVNTIAADFGEQVMGPCYLRVRLEDLCAAPGASVRGLAEFIDTGDIERLVQASTHIISKLVTLDRWRQQSAEEIDRLLPLGAQTLQRFSYAVV